jgi:hypothetical protein
MSTRVITTTTPEWADKIARIINTDSTTHRAFSHKDQCTVLVSPLEGEPIQKPANTCDWNTTEDSVFGIEWKSSCRIPFTVAMGENELPAEYGYFHCPSCGRKITIEP